MPTKNLNKIQFTLKYFKIMHCIY